MPLAQARFPEGSAAESVPSCTPGSLQSPPSHVSLPAPLAEAPAGLGRRVPLGLARQDLWGHIILSLRGCGHHLPQLALAPLLSFSGPAQSLHQADIEIL